MTLGALAVGATITAHDAASTHSHAEQTAIYANNNTYVLHVQHVRAVLIVLRTKGRQPGSYSPVALGKLK